MRICIQILGDVVRVQHVANEPDMSLDYSEEFTTGKIADALRKLGNGQHEVDDAFFEPLQDDEE